MVLLTPPDTRELSFHFLFCLFLICSPSRQDCNLVTDYSLSSNILKLSSSRFAQLNCTAVLLLDTRPPALPGVASLPLAGSGNTCSWASEAAAWVFLRCNPSDQQVPITDGSRGENSTGKGTEAEATSCSHHSPPQTLQTSGGGVMDAVLHLPCVCGQVSVGLCSLIWWGGNTAQISVQRRAWGRWPEQEKPEQKSKGYAIGLTGNTEP